MTEAVGLEIFKGRLDEDTGLYKVVRTLNLRVQYAMSSLLVKVVRKA